MTRGCRVQYATPADLLAHALALPPLDTPPAQLAPGACCAITGQPIQEGYRVMDRSLHLVGQATTEFLDNFRGGIHGHLSDAAARCIRAGQPGSLLHRSLLVFEDGTVHLPLINLASAAEQGRPCWRTLARAVWPARQGQRCVVILTTDTKRRLWPRARVGTLGSHTVLLLHDPESNTSNLLAVDWPRLLTCLDLVEQVYGLGFSKTSVRVSLYGQTRAVQMVGLTETRRLDRALAAWRDQPEFTVALLIAQRTESVPVAPPAHAPAPKPKEKLKEKETPCLQPSLL